MIQIALQAVPFSVLDEIMGTPNCPATWLLARSRCATWMVGKATPKALRSDH